MHDEPPGEETIAALPDSGIPEAAKTLLAAGSIRAPPAPGQIGGIDRFEIIRCLGSGGMGVVFLARDPSAGRHVAIKVLNADLSDRPEAVHRFLTEARHMAKFSHPHILPVLEVCDRPAGPYYVTPLIEDGSLAQRLRPGQPLPADEVLAVSIGVAEALDHAHRRGIIHRDLKPGNVLMDRGGAALLCDFGLVRTVFNDSFVEVNGSHREGTAAYMSPAVAAGEAEDTRCDIYSFGAMLYELLTGAAPYSGRSNSDILRQVRAGPPPPITGLNPKAPEPLVRVAEGAMARDLGQRYATMGHVLTDLQRVQAGKRPLGPGAGHGTLEWLRASWESRRVVLLLAAFPVLLSVLWTGWYLGCRPPHRAEAAATRQADTVPAATTTTAAPAVQTHPEPESRTWLSESFDALDPKLWLLPGPAEKGVALVTNPRYGRNGSGLAFGADAQQALAGLCSRRALNYADRQIEVVVDANLWPDGGAHSAVAVVGLREGVQATVGTEESTLADLFVGLAMGCDASGAVTLTAKLVHGLNGPETGERHVSRVPEGPRGWRRIGLRTNRDRTVAFLLDGEVFYRSVNGMGLRADGNAALLVAGRGAAMDNLDVVVREDVLPAYGSDLSLSSLSVNGRSVTPVDQPVVETEPGQMLLVALEFRLSRRGRAGARFPVAATVSWDRGERAVLAQDVPPGEARLRYDLRKAAPMVPGVYWIVVLAGTVFDTDELLGCDHWLANGGPPEGPYGNGNDVWDWSPRQLMAAFNGLPVHGTMDGGPIPFLARAVKVVVRGQSDVAK